MRVDRRQQREFAHLDGGILVGSPFNLSALCTVQHRLTILVVDVVCLFLHAQQQSRTTSVDTCVLPDRHGNGHLASTFSTRHPQYAMHEEDCCKELSGRTKASW